jgi:hypothetical protein
MALDTPQEQLGIFPGMNESSILDNSVNTSQLKRKKSKSKKRRGGSHRSEVTIDGRKIQVGGNSLHEHDEHDTAQNQLISAYERRI